MGLLWVWLTHQVYMHKCASAVACTIYSTHLGPSYFRSARCGVGVGGGRMEARLQAAGMVFKRVHLRTIGAQNTAYLLTGSRWSGRILEVSHSPTDDWYIRDGKNGGHSFVYVCFHTTGSTVERRWVCSARRLQPTLITWSFSYSISSTILNSAGNALKPVHVGTYNVSLEPAGTISGEIFFVSHKRIYIRNFTFDVPASRLQSELKLQCGSTDVRIVQPIRPLVPIKFAGYWSIFFTLSPICRWPGLLLW